METIELFVPGRLCLLGEHSDWAGQMRRFNSDIVPGQALVACTEEGIYATASKSDKLIITTLSTEGEVSSFESEMDSEALRRIAAKGGFFSYIAGTAAYIATYYDISGVNLNCYKMTLPQKKGLSSSAAICVLTARALNKLYGLNLSVRGEMEAAYHGELLTPSRCGRLDQACAYGRGIVDMQFDNDSLDVTPAKVGAPLYLVFADLNAHKDTVTILRDLNSAYPYPKTDEHRALHQLLGMYNEKLIAKARDAILTGDAKMLGTLMLEAQDEFDKYATPLSPVELKSETLHKVLADEGLKKWIFGGKGVGSQGDGSIQFVAKGKSEQFSLIAYLRDVYGLDAYSLTIPKTAVVRKAIVPVAGYGLRMYPATKVVKKEFLPIIDRDGKAKPALMIILEELINAGIEEICLIIQPGEEQTYRSMFEQLSDERIDRMPKDLQNFEQRLSRLKNMVTFVEQEQQFGFGHAVLQARNFAGNTPVLLVLGDHLAQTYDSRSASEQLLGAYEQTESLTVGLWEVPLDDARKYGLVGGDLHNGLIKLSSLVEKPTVEFAKSNLGIDGKQYGLFMYVLTPSVFAELDEQFKNGKSEFGEFQLTTALAAVMEKQGAFGVVIDGVRYDIGTPNKYREAVYSFGR